MSAGDANRDPHPCQRGAPTPENALRGPPRGRPRHRTGEAGTAAQLGCSLERFFWEGQQHLRLPPRNRNSLQILVSRALGWLASREPRPQSVFGAYQADELMSNELTSMGARRRHYLIPSSHQLVSSSARDGGEGARRRALTGGPACSHRGSGRDGSPGRPAPPDRAGPRTNRARIPIRPSSGRCPGVDGKGRAEQLLSVGAGRHAGRGPSCQLGGRQDPPTALALARGATDVHQERTRES